MARTTGSTTGLHVAVPRDHLVISCPSGATDGLGMLASAPGVSVVTRRSGLPGRGELKELAAGADGVLVVGDHHVSPRTAVPGPVIADALGRLVPLGWLPDAGPVALDRFARSTAAVRARRADRSATTTLAVLGARSRHYVDLAGRIDRTIRSCASPVRTVDWSATVLGADELIDDLGIGPAAAIYVGHGRPTGWAGNAIGMPRRGSIDAATCGAILSLTCLTAGRDDAPTSFAEQLVLDGVCAACFGAVRTTDHPENARWALRLARALGNGATTIGDLVARAWVPIDAGLGYRIVGDPLAPLLDAPGAAARADAITGAMWGSHLVAA